MPRERERESGGGERARARASINMHSPLRMICCKGPVKGVEHGKLSAAEEMRPNSLLKRSRLGFPVHREGKASRVFRR